MQRTRRSIVWVPKKRSATGIRLLWVEEEAGMKIVARLLAFLSAASGVLYVRIRCPIGPLKGGVWMLRLLGEALTPVIALSGAVGLDSACWCGHPWRCSLDCSVPPWRGRMCGG
jgi:hypothetical protein